MALTDKLGSRIGPRLAEIMASTLTAHKVGSLDTDIDVRHLANWKTLTGLGLEIGDMVNGIWSPVVNNADSLRPEMARVLKLAASGEHQGYSIGMGTALGVALGPFSALFDNDLAPFIYRYVSEDPNLIPTIDALLRMGVAGVIGPEDLVKFAAYLGYDSSWVDKLTELSFAQPGLSEYFALKNRGIVDPAELTHVLTRFGYPSWLAPSIDRLSEAVLSPADAALAVLRNNLTLPEGQQIAGFSGVSNETFQTLIDNTGEPPGLAELLLLRRRGQIDDTRLDRGIRQSRVRDEWIDAIHDLSILPPSQAEAVEALVESQTDHDTALRRYTEAGGDPDWFETAVGVAGAAPSPMELGVMANRGIIPWDGLGPDVLSFAQGVFEGRSKNKWLPIWQKLAVYLPPPRTIVAMVKDGSLTHDEALDLLQKAGLPADLAAKYVLGASNAKLAKHKEITVGNIQSLYEEQGIDRQTATALLSNEGYSDEEAAYILWLSDFARYKKAFDAGLTRAHSLYTGHKIDQNGAIALLTGLQVPAAQRDGLIAIWGYEREANVKELTPAQIKSAANKNVITADDAKTRLIQQGYTSDDADIFLAI